MHNAYFFNLMDCELYKIKDSVLHLIFYVTQIQNAKEFAY